MRVFDRINTETPSDRGRTRHRRAATLLLALTLVAATVSAQGTPVAFTQCNWDGTPLQYKECTPWALAEAGAICFKWKRSCWEVVEGKQICQKFMVVVNTGGGFGFAIGPSPSVSGGTQVMTQHIPLGPPEEKYVKEVGPKSEEEYTDYWYNEPPKDGPETLGPGDSVPKPYDGPITGAPKPPRRTGPTTGAGTSFATALEPLGLRGRGPLEALRARLATRIGVRGVSAAAVLLDPFDGLSLPGPVEYEQVDRILHFDKDATLLFDGNPVRFGGAVDFASVTPGPHTLVHYPNPSAGPLATPFVHPLTVKASWELKALHPPAAGFASARVAFTNHLGSAIDIALVVEDVPAGAIAEVVPAKLRVPAGRTVAADVLFSTEPGYVIAPGQVFGATVEAHAFGEAGKLLASVPIQVQG